MEPIPGEVEPATGNPQAVNVSPYLVRLDMAGEREATAASCYNHRTVKVGPRAKPEKIGNLLINNLVVLAGPRNSSRSRVGVQPDRNTCVSLRQGQEGHITLRANTQRCGTTQEIGFIRHPMHFAGQ